MSRHVFPAILAFLIVVTIPSQSAASTNGEIFPVQSWTLPGTVALDGEAINSRAARQWRVTFDAPTATRLSIGDPPAAADQARTQAVQYSDAYNTRRKIHMMASYATLPLFAAQYWSGKKLYDGEKGGLADAHGALAAGVVGLFALNSVTGVWNLMESRGDPNGRTRRLVHSVLMLGADAGFAATGLLAPGDDEGRGGGAGRSTHRTVAITSMGVATAGYLYMLFTR